MTHHSSYSTPRSKRLSGSYGGQRGCGNKYNAYNKRSRKDNKTPLTLVYFMLPFTAISLIILFLAVSAPKINYTVSDIQDYKTVGPSIRICSLLPLKEMTVAFEAKSVELIREKDACKAAPEDNGALGVRMTGQNGTIRRAYERIVILDDVSPFIDGNDYVMEDGQLTVIASNSQSDVNYDTAYAVDEKEETIKPIDINKDTGGIVFVMNTSSLIVYIEDFAGNTFRAPPTNRTEGIDTSSRDSKFPSNGTNGTSGNGSSSDSNTNSSSTKGTTKAKRTTKATKTTKKAKEITKAAKAAEKAKEIAEATKATEGATQAIRATSAANATKATEALKPTGSTTAPVTSPTTAPVTSVVPGPGESNSPTQVLTQASQAMPGGDSSDTTIVPIT